MMPPNAIKSGVFSTSFKQMKEKSHSSNVLAARK
jgi:hypothetical protein